MAIGVLDRSHDRQRRSGISWVQPPRSGFGQRQVAEKLATLAQLREQDLDPEPPGGGKSQIREGVAPDRRVSLSDPTCPRSQEQEPHLFWI